MADQVDRGLSRQWHNRRSSGELPVIYRGPDAKLAKAFGIPDGYRFHGQVVHFPALVVLDGKGKELFRYVGKNNGGRMPTADFTAKLAAIASKR